MRRALIAIVLLLLACNRLTPAPTQPPTAAPTVTPSATAAPTLLPTATPAPDLYIAPGDVLVHPDGGIYEGDLVSVEVFAHDGAQVGLSHFQITLYHGDPAAGIEIATAPAAVAGLGGRLQATFLWAWDTTGLEGEHTLTAVLDPRHQIERGNENRANDSLAFTIMVLPRPAHPPARWLTTESECCVFNYLSGTAAERDIEQVKDIADNAVRSVEESLERTRQNKIVFNLINRLLGHGGFASEVVTLSYLDRDYAGGGLDNVFRHEAAHVLIRQTGNTGNMRPSIIEEGLATYIAGGHFKPEPLTARMVGVLALNRYIPLQPLADDFYRSQHEIGYLQGAALIEYLVDTYGWDQFEQMLGAFQSSNSPAATLDAGLRFAYGKSLAQIEFEWLAYLQLHSADPRWVNDIADTVAFYDTVRRYQQAYDPSAYFLTAWTPDIQRAVRDNITADYLRHPATAQNIALETMLVAADVALDTGDHDSTVRLLDAVNRVLDADGNFAADPLANDYLTIAQIAILDGLTPQGIAISADTAQVTAFRWPQIDLIDVRYMKINGVWKAN